MRIIDSVKNWASNFVADLFSDGTTDLLPHEVLETVEEMLNTSRAEVLIGATHDSIWGNPCIVKAIRDVSLRLGGEKVTMAVPHPWTDDVTIDMAREGTLNLFITDRSRHREFVIVDQRSLLVADELDHLTFAGGGRCQVLPNSHYAAGLAERDFSDLIFHSHRVLPWTK